MTIKKLIEVLQAHGDTGAAEVNISYVSDFGAGDQDCVVRIIGVDIRISEDDTVTAILLKGDSL